MTRWRLGLLALLLCACGSHTPSKSPLNSSATTAEPLVATDEAIEIAPGFPHEIQKTDDCGMTAEDFLGEDQQTLVRCPTGCTRHSLTGTDIYPTNAPACVAAVHAGVLPFEGGLVLLTRTEGLSEYKGSEQHHVHSASSGHYPAAFSMQRVDDDGRVITPSR